MASQGRLIDQVPDKKDPMEMEILILGMPRTGIISLRTALSQIGYKPFHGQMMDVYPEFYPLWEEALRAKYYGEGEPYGRQEYDKLLGDFNISCNFPGTLVAEDLIKAYPNAKVILTNRDVDKWLYSMKQSVDSAVTWKSFDWIAPWDPTVMGPWWAYHKFQHGLRRVLAPKGERQAYLDHYARVRELVPAERLLDYSVSEGWEPLCKFLGRDIPAAEFPHINKTNQFLDGRTRRWWRALGFMVVKIGTPVAISTAASWFFWPKLNVLL
ncbi:hypothetical protein K490DRAFT_72458 [Saccharata proteae CBS 121410]|uniref:NAD dependent epimerase/dehydratase n=1 Tax=Saccharata proteae CBS 121410 TaxID=1314787 RepID=A0A6A5YCY5_9PEZI|nr:hypothetical protein K490DRAFT_72458 [Saccharata proteae CBS 121410]